MSEQGNDKSRDALTPRTEAVHKHERKVSRIYRPASLLEHARQLERELTEKERLLVEAEVFIRDHTTDKARTPSSAGTATSEPQVVGRVWRTLGMPVRAMLNSVGRELEDDAPLYSTPPSATTSITADDLERWIEKLKREQKTLADGLAVSILGSDYGDRCHLEGWSSGPKWLQRNQHVRTPPEFVEWARKRMGENYDPTCQAPVKDAIKALSDRDVTPNG